MNVKLEISDEHKEKLYCEVDNWFMKDTKKNYTFFDQLILQLMMSVARLKELTDAMIENILGIEKLDQIKKGIDTLLLENIF